MSELRWHYAEPQCERTIATCHISISDQDRSFNLTMNYCSRVEDRFCRYFLFYLLGLSISFTLAFFYRGALFSMSIFDWKEYA